MNASSRKFYIRTIGYNFNRNLADEAVQGIFCILDFRFTLYNFLEI